MKISRCVFYVHRYKYNVTEIVCQTPLQRDIDKGLQKSIGHSPHLSSITLLFNGQPVNTNHEQKQP